MRQIILIFLACAIVSACSAAPASISATETPMPTKESAALPTPTRAVTKEAPAPKTTQEFETRAMLDKNDPQYVNCLGYPVTKKYLSQYTDAARQRGWISEPEPEITAGELPYPNEPFDCYYLRYVNPAGEVYIIYRQEPMEDYVFLQVGQ